MGHGELCVGRGSEGSCLGLSLLQNPWLPCIGTKGWSVPGIGPQGPGDVSRGWRDEGWMRLCSSLSVS